MAGPGQSHHTYHDSPSASDPTLKFIVLVQPSLLHLSEPLDVYAHIALQFSIICSLSMNDEETLTFDYWVSFLLSSSRKYIGRELTSNIPEKSVQISAGLTVDALAHDRVTKA